VKISTKGRYALRLAIDVARWGTTEPVSLTETAERQGISVKYLEQIARKMTHAGIIQSTRGAHGGYQFARPTDQVTAGDILRVCEGGTAPVACLEDDFGLCPRRGECETISFWEGLDQAIENYVDSVSIADLVANSVHSGDNAC
jgi:Rrf2 family protein